MQGKQYVQIENSLIQDNLNLMMPSYPFVGIFNLILDLATRICTGENSLASHFQYR